MILSCVPPTGRDALIHHLAVPKLYLKHGGIYEIPGLEFSYYPMNLDLLYLIPLYFGNDIIPKFIHFGFASLTAWLLFDYLRRRLGSVYGFLAALFFLSIPIVVKLSITAYVDLGLIFFSTGSLLYLLRWVESGFQRRFLIISAMLCGLGLGTKYNGLISFLLLALLVPFMYARYAPSRSSSFSKSCLQGIMFLLVTLVFFSPWMIRNFAWTNNPIYPLYDHIFNPNPEVSRTVHGLFSYRSFAYHESWWEMALLPIRIFFQGQDGNPKYFDGRLNPFLLLLPLFAFYRTKSHPEFLKREKCTLLFFSISFFVVAFFTVDMRIRYIAPIIPPLVILAVLGTKRMVAEIGILSAVSLRRAASGFILILWCSAFGLNGLYIFKQYVRIDPLSYIDGEVSKDEYLTLRCPEYPAMKYINMNLPASARILFLFVGKRGYYCDRDYVLDRQHGRSELLRLAVGSKDARDLAAALSGKGITHLLVRFDFFNEWAANSFSDFEKKIVSNLFKSHLQLVHATKGYGLFRLNERKARME